MTIKLYDEVLGHHTSLARREDERGFPTDDLNGLNFLNDWNTRSDQLTWLHA